MTGIALPRLAPLGARLAPLGCRLGGHTWMLRPYRSTDLRAETGHVCRRCGAVTDQPEAWERLVPAH